MKELIRQILREHTINKVTLEEIILPENFINELLIEGTATVRVPNELNRLLDNKIESYHNFSNGGERWFCPNEFIERNNNELKCDLGFNLHLTKHWKQRILRDLEPEYNIINGVVGKHSHKNIIRPESFEGIDLVINNLNLIINYINNSKNWSNGTNKSLLLKKNNYSEIIALFKINKTKYRINFITQIKGEPFFDTPQLKSSQNLKNVI